MNNNFKKISTNVLVICGLITVLLCASCEGKSLIETYDEYVPSKVVSLATPDSVAAVATDYNKLLFRVYVNSDPKIKKAVIALYDDDETDEDDKVVAVIDIDRVVYLPEVYEVVLDLEEGGNEYFVHLEDNSGNKSDVKFDVFGTVLGDTFKQGLVARQYSNVELYSDSEAVINWVSNRTINSEGEEVAINQLLVKTVLTYTSSLDGSVQTIIVDESEEETIIPDFISEGTYSYTTFYKERADSPYLFESNPTDGTFPEKI